jgi:hypothetical protein
LEATFVDLFRPSCVLAQKMATPRRDRAMACRRWRLPQERDYHQRYSANPASSMQGATVGYSDFRCI